jgi:type I restriction enzyme, S subunit
MRESWPTTTVADVARVALSGVDKHIVAGETSVHLCNYLDVYRNWRLTQDMEFSTGSATPGEISRFQLQRGDVLITKDSETPDDIGIPAVVVDDLLNTICGYHLALIRPKPTVDSMFLAYLLESDAAKRHFLRTANGVTRFGLGLRAISTFQLPLPPIGEQVTIASTLEAVDAARECVRAERGQAIELKRGLLQKLLSRGTRGEPTKETSIGTLPQSWEVVPLKSVISEFQYGLSVAMQLTGSLPILRMGNLQRGMVEFDDLKYVSLPNRVTDRYLLHRGDVLFNRTNSQEHVGKIGVYRDDGPAVFASYLIRLQPDVAQIDPYYLGQALNSYSAQCRIKRYATPGVQQVNINATNLGRVLIPLPSGTGGLDEQRLIAETLEALDARVHGYDSSLLALSVLKRSLMQTLLATDVRPSTPQRQAVS